MVVSSVLKLGTASVVVFALAACNTSAGIGTVSAGIGPGSNSAAGGGGAESETETAGGGGDGGGGNETSGTTHGLAAYGVGRMGQTTDVANSPIKGSAFAASFTERSGNQPGTIVFESSVSPGGQSLGGKDVTFTGMMKPPTDNPTQAVFYESYYAYDNATSDSTGEQINLYARLGDIKPQHVRLMEYRGPGTQVGDRVNGFAVGGELTPVDKLPSGNAVVYNGNFTGQVAASSNGYTDGAAQATVNFTDATIQGRIWNPNSSNPAGTPDIRFSGEVEGSQFHATSITSTRNDKTTELITAAGGTLVGGIFGAGGEELGAAVHTPHVMATDNSDYTWVRGGIVATRE